MLPKTVRLVTGPNARDTKLLDAAGDMVPGVKRVRLDASYDSVKIEVELAGRAFESDQIRDPKWRMDLDDLQRMAALLGMKLVPK